MGVVCSQLCKRECESGDAVDQRVQLQTTKDLAPTVDTGFTPQAAAASLLDDVLREAAAQEFTCAALAEAKSVYAEARRAVENLEVNQNTSRAGVWRACDAAWARALETEVAKEAWEAEDSILAVAADSGARAVSGRPVDFKADSNATSGRPAEFKAAQEAVAAVETSSSSNRAAAWKACESAWIAAESVTLSY